jgi:hypothetical protein
MAKTYKVGISWDYTPDDNNYLDWEDEYEIQEEDKDEDFVARSEEELINFLKNEMTEAIYNGLKYNDIWNMIDVEVVDDGR